jgi:hypothetical protein
MRVSWTSNWSRTREAQYMLESGGRDNPVGCGYAGGLVTERFEGQRVLKASVLKACVLKACKSS